MLTENSPTSITLRFIGGSGAAEAKGANTRRAARARRVAIGGEPSRRTTSTRRPVRRCTASSVDLPLLLSQDCLRVGFGCQGHRVHVLVDEGERVRDGAPHARHLRPRGELRGVRRLQEESRDNRIRLDLRVRERSPGRGKVVRPRDATHTQGELLLLRGVRDEFEEFECIVLYGAEFPDCEALHAEDWAGPQSGVEYDRIRRDAEGDLSTLDCRDVPWPCCNHRGFSGKELREHRVLAWVRECHTMNLIEALHEQDG